VVGVAEGTIEALKFLRITSEFISFGVEVVSVLGVGG
jgi:hypothetical protein